MGKIIFIVSLFIFFIVLVGSTTYISNNEAKFEGDVQILGTLDGGSPLKLGYEGITFQNSTKDIRFSIYQAQGFNYDVPSAFANSLIIQTDSINNPDKMEICFWDKQNQLMLFCINEGGLTKATTIRRSFQIVGNVSVKENDENFTVCEEANYVDCNTDITGSDLFVQDDIESKGSIYSNEHITIKDFLRLESVLDKGNCSVSTHGNIVYELDVDLLGTHYACRQKKDVEGYEWKPLY